MSELQISQRYAQALYELSDAAKSLEGVYASLTGIGVMIKEVVDFHDFLQNPLLTHDQHIQVLQPVFKGRVPDLVYQFLLYISLKGRLSMLSSMIEAFDALFLAAHQKTRAQVQTAMPIDEDIKSKISAAIKHKYSKDVLVDWQVEPELLGGFKVFIEGKLHDYAFSSKLKEYRQKILQ